MSTSDKANTATPTAPPQKPAASSKPAASKSSSSKGKGASKGKGSSKGKGKGSSSKSGSKSSKPAAKKPAAKKPAAKTTTPPKNEHAQEALVRMAGRKNGVTRTEYVKARNTKAGPAARVIKKLVENGIIKQDGERNGEPQYRSTGKALDIKAPSQRTKRNNKPRQSRQRSNNSGSVRERLASLAAVLNRSEEDVIEMALNALQPVIDARLAGL